MARRSHDPDGLAPPRGYAQSVEVAPIAGLAVVAGQAPVGADGVARGVDDLAEQTNVCLANLERAVTSLSRTVGDVVQVRYLIVCLDAQRRE